jgi:phosphoribosylformylglycinamidine (FGAM) synthase PurS component
MEKLTETINALKVSKSVKESIIQIAEKEQIHIQQVCRKLLSNAIEDYTLKNSEEDSSFPIIKI